MNLPLTHITLLLQATFIITIIGCKAQTGAMTSDDNHQMKHFDKDYRITVEAEDFDRQRLASVRQWYRTDSEHTPTFDPDPDGNHSEGASGGAYLEILPDTRTNHDEELINGVNFTNEPGVMAILDYDVYFEYPGRYYVWVRTFFTGTEDNGIHVGINDTWPESGQRLQWCEGRDQWTWDSKQRTAEEHCGIPKLIYLDVPSKGQHTISFSMREDGFEFDKWEMNMTYVQPKD